MKPLQPVRRAVPIFVLAILMGDIASMVEAASCVIPVSTTASTVDAIVFTPSYEEGTYPAGADGSPECAECDEAVADARDAWNAACTSYKIPHAVASAPVGASSMTVNVFFQGTNTGEYANNNCGADRCGCAFINYSNGHPVSGLIRMFQRTNLGVDCTAQWSGVATHEFGHAFGLDDVSAGCTNFIMGTLTGAVGINGLECEQADSNFDTSFDDDDSTSSGGSTPHPCSFVPA